MTQSAVEALAVATTAAWSGTTENIIALWDADAFRFYKAEEITEIYHRFDQAVDYWRANEAMHETVRLSFGDIAFLPLEGRFAAVTMALRWAAWSETPDAAITYVRRLYENEARI